MASHKPVPSKAAINALRGVVFTTSCSVVLLAEERRRRIKIARSAIDNARKLHTVKSNRGPIALTDLGSWESRLSDEVLAMPTASSMNSFRRRRRSTISEDVLTDALNVHRQKDGPTTNIESNATAQPQPRDSMPARDAVDAISLRTLQQNSDATDKQTIAKTKTLAAHSRLEATSTQDTVTTFKALSLDNAASTQSQPITATKNARQYIEATSGLSSPARPRYREVTTVLHDLMDSLTEPGLDAADTLERVELAIAVFQRVASFGVAPQNTARQLRQSGLRLLRHAAISHPEKLSIALDVQLLLHRNKLPLVAHLVTFLVQGGKHNVLCSLLLHMAQAPESCSWHHGHLIYRLFQRRITSESSYEQTKNMYSDLLNAGLLRDCGVSSQVEYNIRRLMVVAGLRAGDSTWASAEMKALCQSHHSAASVDVGLQGLFIMQHTQLGQWSCVREGIQKLGNRLDTPSAAWHRLLDDVTEEFAKHHHGQELESWIRELPAPLGLEIRHSWVKAVLDTHAAARETGAMSEWLKFCATRGFALDDAFLEQFCRSCRQNWSFGDKSIAWIRDMLRDSTSVSDEAWQKIIRGSPASKPTSSPTDLRSAALALMEAEGGHTEGAFSLIEEAHSRGEDVTEALTPVLMAEMDAGRDANSLVNETLRRGARVHDSVYNKAAQTLCGQKDLQGAVEICKLAAAENGKGDTIYNEYNFSNLVFAYTGLAQYESLSSVLREFSSSIEGWRGSKTCKESIKRAMKTVAIRGTHCESTPQKHVKALDSLDAALMHVKKCRADRNDRKAVTEAFVKVFQPARASVPVTLKPGQSKRVHGEAGIEESIMTGRAEAL